MKIFEQKLDFSERAASKVGSLDNSTHKPGGGQKKVRFIGEIKCTLRLLNCLNCK